MNKKTSPLLLILLLCCLAACSEKEQYQQAVLAQVKEDQDIKDYKINPERIAACIVDTTSKHMPGLGLLPFYGERKQAYMAYTKMISLKKSNNPQQLMSELRSEFGSAKALSDAHSNYSLSTLDCQTSLISETEAALDKDAPETESKSMAVKEAQPESLEQVHQDMSSGTNPAVSGNASVPAQTQVQSK